MKDLRLNDNDEYLNDFNLNASLSLKTNQDIKNGDSEKYLYDSVLQF